jgi:two-component sensor histidine kinase
MLNLELLHSRDDERAAQILADSINRIKTMSRLYDRLQGAPDVTTVDMQSYVRALATDVGRSQRESRAVHLDVEVDPLHVVVDQAISIGLIVNELVTNSLKHAIPAGRSGTIHIRVHGRSGYIELRVSDSGPGVDADYLERRSDSLGIQIVTAIVERHGGEFTLEDPEHSAFLVRLPRRLTSS